MLESLAAWVLRTYVGEYVENLNTDQLSIGYGTVELENLPLRKTALQGLELPLEVKSGFIGRLKLSIPFRHPKSEPWIIHIDKLYLIAGPLSQYQYDEEQETKRERERKQKQLDGLEMQWQFRRSKENATETCRNFTGARLSFAVKLSINEWAGRHKAFREEMRHLTGVSSKFFFMKLHLNGNESSDDEDGKEDSNPDPLDGDFEPSMNDSNLQEMEERLQTLTDETSDMEKLRNLFKEVQSRYDQAREHVGELIRQLL